MPSSFFVVKMHQPLQGSLPLHLVCVHYHVAAINGDYRRSKLSQTQFCRALITLNFYSLIFNV